MGLLDRFRRTAGEEDDGRGDAEPGLDLDARRPQLEELSAALRQLADGMSGEDAPRNPGWSERVGEYRVAANGAARLAAAPELTRTEVLDLCAEVRPLFVRRPGLPDAPPVMVALEDRQDRVLAAVDALREVLATERG